VLFISFDETDTQAHQGRYDRVLASAHKADAFIAELWETVQQMSQYRGKTTLLITTDHGRGDPPVEWKNHSDKTAGAEFIWLGVLGPDTPAHGERSDVAFGQDQIAATLASLLGLDYCAEAPKAGKPIAGVVRSGVAGTAE
jgi:bisphosphoglycerate-independent phosphoglycerate mutase (AlkP superfamily)